MTWRKLATLIESLPESMKDADVRRFDSNEGEFYRMGALTLYDKAEFDSEALPDGTPYLEA